MDREKLESQYIVNRQMLESQYNAGTIGKQALSKLRRFKLQDVLDDILALSDEAIVSWLDDKKSKLSPKKLADAVGYETKPVNLRQSFKSKIKATELELRQRNLIVNEQKTTKQVGDENVLNFLGFINERLNDEEYQWPVNNKKRLYQKKIWSLFLGQEMDEIKSAPAFFSRNPVKEKLAGIDVMIVNDEVKTACYASDVALDEMQDNMTSAAMSKLRQQLKEVRDQLAAEREERKRLEVINHELENEVDQYKQRAKAMQSSRLADIKVVGAH